MEREGGEREKVIKAHEQAGDPGNMNIQLRSKDNLDAEVLSWVGEEKDFFLSNPSIVTG